ncbi:protein Niban 1 [Pygocentrus nattereri]|uniref:Niban 1/2/3 domain-containing protein n=1 Tax=Pygocentrus nattereri TaxID=42514 RepID=A0AAR2IJA3_PYGNA|nr:protein Niban 1 [Pygocentrus nattereri]
MGVSSSSLLDESKANYIRGRTEAELKNFSPHYKRQYCVAFFSQLQDEVEQHRTGQTQLLKQKEPPQASVVVYKDSLQHFDDSKKWKERFVVVRADYSLELHDSQETFTKGTPARHTLLLTGGTVLTSEEKYSALVDKAFPDLNSSKEEGSPSVVTLPGPFPVYLRLPFKRDSYFSFQQQEKQIQFISTLSDCIRHQNHDFLKMNTCEVQAFLKAIHFYRQEKGHYESWEMLVGSDSQVLANLVMEELLPSLQTELLPKLKGKKAERKRVWFTTVEATYELVQEQLREGLQSLKDECREAAKQQEALIRSDMDQIVNSRTFLETKLQGLVSEPAVKFCSESVAPYLASILEELMGPVSSGFQAVRQRLEIELSRICKDFAPGGDPEKLTKALEEVGRAQLEDCYQHVTVLKEQLHELRNRFKFSNSTLLVHTTQGHMQQLMENAAYTFETLLQSAVKDKPDKLATVMDKAKLRVLKQYDYDSSTVRKKIFQDALVDITLPAIRRNLAPTCKTELQNYEQYIFADYTNFIQVENVYDDILLNILNNEVNKVVKEAASLKKHNLFVDSTELQCISQSSLNDSRTPPLSAPSSPAKVPVTQKAEEKSTSPLVGNGCLESQSKQDGQDVPVEDKREITPESDQLSGEKSPKSETSDASTVSDASPPGQDNPPASSEITATVSEAASKPEASTTESPAPMCNVSVAKPDVASFTVEGSSPDVGESVVMATVASENLNDCPTIMSPIEQQNATDKAVYLIPPAGLKAGSAVPLAEEADSEENSNVEAQKKEETEDTTDSPAPVTCSEVSETEPTAIILRPTEPCPGTVQADASNVEDPSDSQAQDKDHAETQMETTSCGSPGPAVVNEASNQSDGSETDTVATSSTIENAQELSISCDPPAGGNTSPQSAPIESEGNADCSDAEGEELLDSVKAIRDLVVEIIEVEDIVSPCPDSMDA